VKDPRDAAISFEAVKTSLSQTKDGMILRLAIHPSDMPRQLMTDWVGSRYQIAMVKLDDNDEPAIDPATELGKRAVQSAGMLCRNEAFQQFMVAAGYAGAGEVERDPVMYTANGLRDLLGVQSRSDLANDERAQKLLEEVKAEFEVWRSQNPHRSKTERRDG